MKTKITLLFVMALMIASVVLVACGSSPAQPTAVPTQPQAQPTTALTPAAPAIDGAKLLEDRCTVCHTLDRVKNTGRTSEQWSRIVTAMLGEGAKLTADEQIILVDYLANTYKP